MSFNKQIAADFLYASLTQLEKDIFESNARTLKRFADSMRHFMDHVADNNANSNDGHHVGHGPRGDWDRIAHQGKDKDVITTGLCASNGGLGDTKAMAENLPGIVTHSASSPKNNNRDISHVNVFEGSPKRAQNITDDDQSGDSLQFLKAKPSQAEAEDNIETVRLAKRGRRKSDPELEDVSGPHHGAFGSLANFKSEVQQGMIDEFQKPGGNYMPNHWATKVVTHHWFDFTTLCMIFINALWIAYDTDFNDSPLLATSKTQFQVAEHIFCAFFSMELALRFLALEDKRYGWRERWFCFDSVLVMFMIFETWILSLMVVSLGHDKITKINVSVLGLFRLLRLARLARMARLVREMPELMILVKGLLAALRSVCFTLCLLLIIMYCFAIAIVQLMGDCDFKDDWFKNVPEAMVTLILEGILTDQAPLVRESADQGIHNGLLVLLFILLGSLTVMNMLMGVLVEVVSVVASAERDIMDVEYVTSKMFHILEDRGDVPAFGQANRLSDCQITRATFLELMLDSKTCHVVQEVGVDHPALMACADFIFRGGDKTISFSEFIEVILSFRGSQHATVKDIVDLKAHVLQELHVKMQEIINSVTHLHLPAKAFDDDGRSRRLREAGYSTDGFHDINGRGLDANGRARSPPHLPRFPPSMWHREEDKLS